MIGELVLIFPPFVALVKIAEIIVEKISKKNISLSEDEFKNLIKKVVINYMHKVWDEGLVPLYSFDYNLTSSDLDADIQDLFDKRFLSESSSITLTNKAKLFIKNYEERYLSRKFIEIIEKIIDETLEEFLKERQEL